MSPTTFGDPTRFAISATWVEDREPRERLPVHGGWSMGVLELTVGGHTLTRHQQGGTEHRGITWYLLPVFEWLAAHWVPLLHEERFAWRENSAAPAATATAIALRRVIDAEDAEGRRQYRTYRTWWMRHALRAADSSALYPDLFWRRFGDDVELSWTARQPVHAPDGFRLVIEPGAATLSVEDVAGPLWDALTWFVTTAPAIRPSDRDALERLATRLAELRHLSNADLESVYLPERLLRHVATWRERIGVSDRSRRLSDVPAVARLDDPVLMFGSVSPEIGEADVDALLAFMAVHLGGRDEPQLLAHVEPGIGAPLGVPHEEGYELAEQLIDDKEIADGTTVVDIEKLLAAWAIDVVRCNLETDSVRGVALAGEGYAPAILVNGTSIYNRTEAGRRFTLAHELFHVLYDRSRARRVAHTSGPWASPGIEKRANAFAAMLLMPRTVLRQSLGSEPVDRRSIAKTARSMKVGVSALVEHLYNIGMIDAVTRDGFRLRGSASS